MTRNERERERVGVIDKVGAAAEKEEQLQAKYTALKKTGKLEKYIQKKRKKNAAKDKRMLPGRKSTD